MGVYDDLEALKTGKAVPQPEEPLLKSNEEKPGWLKRQGQAAAKIGTDLATGVGEIARTAAVTPTLLAPGGNNPVKSEAKERWTAIGKGSETVLGTLGDAVSGDKKALEDVTKFLFPGWVRLYNKPSSIVTDPVETAWDLVTQAGPTPAALGAYGVRAVTGAAKGAASTAAKVAPKALGGLPEKVATLERKIVPRVNFTPGTRNRVGEWEGARFLARNQAVDTGRAFQELFERSPEAAAAVKTNVTVPRGKRLDPHMLEGVTPGLDDLHKKLTERVTRSQDPIGELHEIGKATELTLGPDGMVTYGKSGAYAALNAADKAVVDNIRWQMTQPVLQLHAMGIDTSTVVRQLMDQTKELNYADFTKKKGKQAVDVMPGRARDEALNWIEGSRHVDLGRETPESYLKSFLEPDDPNKGLGNRARNLTRAAWETRYKGGQPGPMQEALGSMGDFEGWTQKGVPGILKPGEAGALAISHTITSLQNSVNNRRLLDAFAGMRSKDGSPLVLTKGEVVPTRPGGGYYKEIHAGETAAGVPIRPGERLYYHPDVQDVVEVMRGNEIPNFTTTLMKTLKWAHTIPSARTHVGNVASNVQYATIAGHSPLNPKNWGDYTKAYADLFMAQKAIQAKSSFADVLKNGDELFREAVQRGIVVPSAVHAEMTALYGADLLRTARVDDWMGILHQKLTSGNPVSRALNHIYESEDMWFKYAAYRGLRKKGLTPEAAQSEVYSSFPSYAVTSQLGRWFRGEVKLGGHASGMGPIMSSGFPSFPLEHTRIMGWAAKNHPGRLAVAASMPTALKLSAMTAAGTSMDEWNYFQEELRKGDPPAGKQLFGHMAESRKNYIPGLGWRSGDQRVYDVTNWFPIDMNPISGAFGGNMLLGAHQQGVEATRRSPTGEGYVKGLFKGLAPTWLENTVGGVQAGRKQVQQRAGDSLTEPTGNIGRDIVRNVGRAISPLPPKRKEDLADAADKRARGQIGGLNRALREAPKDPTTTDEEKDTIMEDLRRVRERVQEKR